jgi:hypothetical protein
LQSIDFEVSPELILQNLKEGSNANGSVIQTEYGINQITYQVSLTKASIFVENEVFFPGWKAHLEMGNNDKNIEAISTNGIFRTWLLPSGSYRMVASFEFPNSSLFNEVSLFALFIWLSLFIVYLVKSSKQHALFEHKILIKR